MKPALMILGLAIAGASSAPAQATLQPGSRVRLIPSDRYEPRRAGKVISLSQDSVLVRFEPDPIHDLEWSTEQVSRSRLEYLASRRRRKGPGAIIGAFAGGVAGMTVGTRLDKNCWTSGSGGHYCDSQGDADMLLGLAGIVVGANLGALVGWAIRTDTWVPAGGAPGALLMPVVGSRSFGLALHLTPH